MHNAIFGNSLQKVCKILQTTPNRLTMHLGHGIKGPQATNVCTKWTGAGARGCRNAACGNQKFMID